MGEKEEVGERPEDIRQKKTRKVLLKPPTKADNPKKKSTSKEKDKNIDNKTRKISDMFSRKSSKKDDSNSSTGNEKLQSERKVQRPVASKDAMNVSSCQQDYDDKTGAAANCDKNCIIQINISDRELPVKPDLVATESEK